MKTAATHSVLLLSAAILASCTAAPPPTVPVAGSPADLSSLSGEWSGGYSSAATGRSGTIRFLLEGGAGAAFGDVTMIPAGLNRSLEPANRRAGGGATAAPTALAIRFARVEDGKISGMLEPYRDPDCGCVLSTTFTGTVRGDTIEGTFVSRGGGAHATASGVWKVTRKRKEPE
jgi:hypothetical protein